MNNKVTIWDPFRMLSEDSVDRFFSPMSFSECEVDVYEEGDNVFVKIKAAGFDPENLDIDIEDNVLTVSGKKENELVDEKSKKYYRREITTESFSRSVSLPVKVDETSSEAEVKNGIITIKFAKAKESKSKKIEIKTGK